MQTKIRCLPASLAQLDAHPASDQEVAGSTQPAQQHSFMEIDYDHSLPLIQEGQLSVSGERRLTILVNRLED